MRNRAIYDYRVFPARVFLESYGGLRYGDAYLSEDTETKALTDAVAEGYWLHLLTAEYAIMERITNEPRDCAP